MTEPLPTPPVEPVAVPVPPSAVSVPTPPNVTPVVPPPMTVSDEDERALRSSGQRNINKIWEYTQAFIAGSTVTTVLAVSAILATATTAGEGQKVAAFVFLTGVANLVIGFYFGRTNHQRVGGVGGYDTGR